MAVGKADRSEGGFSCGRHSFGLVLLAFSSLSRSEPANGMEWMRSQSVGRSASRRARKTSSSISERKTEKAPCSQFLATTRFNWSLLKEKLCALFHFIVRIFDSVFRHSATNTRIYLSSGFLSFVCGIESDVTHFLSLRAGRSIYESIISFMERKKAKRPQEKIPE